MSMDPALTAAAIEALGSDRFPATLLALLRQTADFDGAVFLAYPQQESLRVLSLSISPANTFSVAN